MKILTKIINFVKKAFRKVADMFKDKKPTEVINDTVKTVTTIASTGLALYAGINAIRVHLIPSIKKNVSSNNKSAHDIMIENRKAGSIDEKLANLKKNSKFSKRSASTINKEDLEILKSIAKTRNSFFQSLSPEDQLNVLEMENFNFEEYANEYRRKSKRPLFHWGKCLKKFGVSPTDKPFREEVDYGFFNFIMRPLDDFIHWLKNDPVPKKVPQVYLVDHPEIPDVECETAFDVVSAARNLDSYLSRNKTVSSNFNVSTSASYEEQQILAEELFRHKTLSKLNKAVNRRMAQSQFNSPNIFDMMEDEKKKKKKKKKKKSDDFSFMEDKPKNKKKRKGVSKEDAELMDSTDKKARELYQYHLQKALNGEIDRKGYKFDF